MKKGNWIGLALLGSLGVSATVLGTAVKANNMPELLTQASPGPTCVDLQEVTTGQTQIRKQIRPGFLGPGNINVDFTVPSTEDFAFYEVTFVPENDANYRVDVNFRYPDGSQSNVWSGSGSAQRGETYTRQFRSPTGEQPFLINTSVVGERNIAYTVGVSACQN